MTHQTILRLLLTCFLLYFAWPYIPGATTFLEQLFWGVWLGFLVLVFGGNLATLLEISRPPIMEQKESSRTRKRIH